MQRQPAPVDRVGDRAAEQAATITSGTSATSADQADGERGVRQLVDLERDRELRQLRAGERDASSRTTSAGSPAISRSGVVSATTPRTADAARLGRVLVRLRTRSSVAVTGGVTGRSRRQPLDGPAVRRRAVAQPVVQPVRPALPELDAVGHDADAAPVRGQRDVDPSGNRRRRARLQRARASRGRRPRSTAGWPRRRAGRRAAGSRSRPADSSAVTRSAAPSTRTWRSSGVPREDAARPAGSPRARGPCASRSW